MSKDMSPEELEAHIRDSLDQISSLLEEWRVSDDAHLTDKAQKVAYWIREYSAYLRREDLFSSKSVPRLKRGSVIMVDFGFRVGKEFGGRHFAVVVDNDNSIYSQTVTVVPLFSLKEHYKENQYTTILPDGIYGPMLERTGAITDEALALIGELEEKTAEERSTPEFRLKAEEVNTLKRRVTRAIEAISHMKGGSVANTCQITTVSKMRIKRPLKKDDPLYGLRLSTADMELINAQMSSLFIFHPAEKAEPQEKQ